MKIGFIGAGNMANAIIGGIVSSGFLKGNEIAIFDLDKNKTTQCHEEYGVIVSENSNELIEQCDCVVLSVKPIVFPKLLPEIKEQLGISKPLLISIAAGKTIESIEKLIGENLSLIRIMPNVNALVFESISAYTCNNNVSEDEIIFTESILNCFGEFVSISEEDFSVFSAIASCSPAYIYMFADTIARVGVKHGLYKSDALKIVIHSMLEAVKENKMTNLKDCEFEKIASLAIEAALNKDKQMK